MALVVVAVGTYFGYRQVAQPACSGETKLTVATAGEIAPAVQGAAEAWVKGGAQVDGICVAVQVSETDPVDVAAVVAGKHGVALAGVGQPSGTIEMPDVWVPDSGTWLLRLRSAASGFAPTNGASIARSPVVIAMPEPIAAAAGWPDKKLSWNDLLAQLTTGTQLRPGVVEPTRDAAGLSGLLALGAAASAGGADNQAATTGVLRALAAGKSALRQDLLARFPRSADPETVASALSAAPLSEEDVVQYNATKPPIRLAALYLEDPSPMSLDYPYAVMPGTDPVKAKAAEGLYRVLATGEFKNRLGAQHLRGPDGTWGDGFNAPTGAPSPAGTPQVTTSPDQGGSAAGGLDPATVDRTLATWTAVTLPARMLAVIDVSGTMGGRVSATGPTRMQITKQAATRGLGLFSDDWAVGLWSFSTNMGGGRDYKELVPIAPVASNRARLVQQLGAIEPKRGGDTGLYDTILAAYKNVQDGWQNGRVNSIVLLTDAIGNDDPDGGISHDGLINELKRIKDPKRPVQLIIIGLGDQVNAGPLQEITGTTGGGVFVAEDPTKIGDIFLRAISLRPTAPR